MALICQLSDPHVSTRTSPVYQRHQTNDKLAQAIDQINQFPYDPDLVIITGDLVEDGIKEEYLILNDILKTCKYPLKVIPGNHDKRSALRVNVQQFAPPGQIDTFLIMDQKLGGARLILLDTLDETSSHGALCQARLEWLTRILTASKEPVIIAMHHPPTDMGVPLMDTIGMVEGRREFHELLNLFRDKVLMILCGHIHRFAVTNLFGIPVISSPSTSHQIAPHFETDDLLKVTDEPPACLLHNITDTGAYQTFMYPLHRVNTQPYHM